MFWSKNKKNSCSPANPSLYKSGVQAGIHVSHGHVFLMVGFCLSVGAAWCLKAYSVAAGMLENIRGHFKKIS